MNVHIYMRPCYCGEQNRLECKLLAPQKWSVVCPSCGIAGKIFPNAILAAQDWNATHKISQGVNSNTVPGEEFAH